MVKDKIRRKKEGQKVEEVVEDGDDDKFVDVAVEDEASATGEVKNQTSTKSSKKGKGKGKGKGKKEKGEGEGKKEKAPVLRDAADDPLVKEAVDIILAGIADPESQKDGKAFVPSDWSTKYKAKLGPYKKFLTAHPGKFALVEDGTGKFIIKRPEDVSPSDQTPAPLIKGTTWQKKLTDAWMAYCLSVPRETRDFELFLAPLPRTARSAKPSGEAPVVAATADDSQKVGKKRKQGTENEVTASAELAVPEVSTKKIKKKKKHVSPSPEEAVDA